MRKIYLLALIPLFTLLGCQQDDLTPSWLVIDDISLSTNEVTEGSNSDGITDAWVYMDDQALGIFELPARIPILAEGEHSFIIYAGVKDNGISATRVRYPFYTRYEASLNLVKGQELEINPTVYYKSNVQFELLEDFEDVGIEFYSAPESDTAMFSIDDTNYPDIVKYGSRCGAVFINETDSLFKAFTNTNLKLPQGEDAYAEIDFMNTNSMIVSLIAQNSGGSQEQPPIVLFNPQNESEMVWKKIYVNLKENVSFEVNATSFELLLTSILDEENSTGIIYLDNIKVLRYE